MFEEEVEERAKDIYTNFFDDVVTYPEVLKAIWVGVQKGTEFGYNKAKEELEKEISILLSCKNCPENKGGYICQKEYEDKCLAQKIQYIKELQEEITELRNNGFSVSAMTEQQLKVALEKGERLEKENAELKARIDNLKNEFEYSENYGKRVQKERHRVVNDNAELREQLTKAKDLLLRFKELKNKPCVVGHSVNMLLYDNICAEAEQFFRGDKK